MEISGMLIWALVVVSLTVFIVLLVKAFKSWGVAHTILLVILFIECWTFLFFVGGVDHYRLALIKTHDKLFEKVEGLKKTVDLEMYGDRSDPQLNLEKFVPLANELNRLTIERGRVWRGAILQNATPATATAPATAIFQLPPKVSNLAVDAPAVGAEPLVATVPIDAGLAVDSVVYLFGEGTDPLGLIPESFVGEFVVTEIKDLEIKTRPTTPLNAIQQTLLTASASWAIYELMPLDSHTAFAAVGSAPEEGAIHGRMDKDEIAKALKVDAALADREPGSFTNITEATKARVLQSYLLDGSRAPEQTPPESLSYWVKFLKDYSLGVDAKGGRSPLEGGYHDSEGSMIDDRLKRDSEAGVVFKIDDLYVFDAPTANRLQREGVVEMQAPVFVRPLNDYAFAFREIRRMKIRTDQDTALLTRENKEAENTTRVTLAQEQIAEEESAKLKLDKAQYDKEAEVIGQVLADLETEIRNKRAELGATYRSILALHESLVRQQRERASTISTP